MPRNNEEGDVVKRSQWPDELMRDDFNKSRKKCFHVEIKLKLEIKPIRLISDQRFVKAIKNVGLVSSGPSFRLK